MCYKGRKHDPGLHKSLKIDPLKNQAPGNAGGLTQTLIRVP